MLECRAMRRRTCTVALLALAVLALFQSGLHTAYAQESPSAKIARLLESTGYTYSKGSNNAWSITFKGDVLPEFDLVISSQQDVLVLFVLVAEKKAMRVTPELMHKMLMLNGEIDKVKVGIDKDGDAFVRIDLNLRVVDAQEFKENVNQLAAAADEVFKVVKPFTTAPK